MWFVYVSPHGPLGLAGGPPLVRGPFFENHCVKDINTSDNTLVSKKKDFTDPSAPSETLVSTLSNTVYSSRHADKNKAAQTWRYQPPLEQNVPFIG